MSSVSFLGLPLPQLGTAESSLRAELFYPMDRSADQDPLDVAFARHFDASAVGSALVTAFVRSGHVTSVVVTTNASSARLERAIGKDINCVQKSGEQFSCRLGTPAATRVHVCGQSVVLFSADATSESQIAKFCEGHSTPIQAPAQNGGIPPVSNLLVGGSLAVLGIGLFLFIMMRRRVRGRAPPS